MEAILRIALGNGKWVAGTVLEIYPRGEEHPFEWGDKAHFLIIKADITEEQKEMIHRRKLKIPLDSFLSFESQEKYKENLTMKRADFLTNGEKPKLEKIVNGKFGSVTPEKQWKKPGEIIDLAMLEELDGLR